MVLVFLLGRKMKPDEIMAFLRKRPEYVKTLKKAVEHEERNASNPHYLGWEWYDVETFGTKLQRLVVDGIAKINFKSRSSTCYLLQDLKDVKAAFQVTKNKPQGKFK